ncbi:MAG: bifunctional isocitrate dehydrogenase kinase/phosphatase [Gammaproteobacteria bacterium]
MDKEHIISECSQTIYDGFQRYNKNFHRITDRAHIRFKQRDWKGHQQDIVDRIELYEKSASRIASGIKKLLDQESENYDLWHEIRSCLGKRIENVPDSAFIKTFFNSTTRRVFGTVGYDPDVEFVFSSMDDTNDRIASLNLKRYPYWNSLETIFSDVLEDICFEIPYENKSKSIKIISGKVMNFCKRHLDKDDEYIRFEFIESLFYQSARAYLVGRIIKLNSIIPLVIAFENTDDGISIDAVLLSEEEVSIVFGYTRSYYFADPNSVEAAVHFLHSILPNKPVDELFTVLGRVRQGKTERYSNFTKHLEKTDDKFTHADGDKGLVMIVFDLPSYNLVFKIIRDRFGYPKTISRQGVIDKYQLVSKHDRAGRLIDTQSFYNIEFPVERFSKTLLDDLLANAKQSVFIKNNKVVFKHVYVERYVRPLNLFIKEVSKGEAELAILDYGQALKDLAQTNIFPGDLLLKNFGVTQHKRIVFYDYDEVALITECNFRAIPETNDPDDEMRASTWYHVSENDIFPEEHLKFLAMNKGLQSLFIEAHEDLLTVEYWHNIKTRHLAGEMSAVIPYFRPTVPRIKSI